MGYIRKEIEIIGKLKPKNVTALFDSGAGSNYIRETFFDGTTAEELGVWVWLDEKNVQLADSRETPGRRVLFPGIRIDGSRFKKVEMIMMKNLNHDAIIGSYFMQQKGINLQLTTEEIVWEI